MRATVGASSGHEKDFASWVHTFEAWSGAVVAQHAWRRANCCGQGFSRSLALTQVDAAVEAAGREAQPPKKTFASGFGTSSEVAVRTSCNIWAYALVCPFRAIMTTDRKTNFRLSPCNATTLRMASRRVTQLYDEALEPCGLRTTQLAILSELAHWSADPPTLAELAAALAIDRSSLGHNLRPLERDGLVVLGMSAVDGRRRHIALTSKGKAKRREALPLWRVAQERFEHIFGRSEAAALRTTLLGIAHHERLASLKD
jgi:DNA-binding MarR family transcriptional regulator